MKITLTKTEPASFIEWCDEQGFSIHIHETGQGNFQIKLVHPKYTAVNPQRAVHYHYLDTPKTAAEAIKALVAVCSTNTLSLWPEGKIVDPYEIKAPYFAPMTDDEIQALLDGAEQE